MVCQILFITIHVSPFTIHAVNESSFSASKNKCSPSTVILILCRYFTIWFLSAKIVNDTWLGLSTIKGGNYNGKVRLRLGD